MNMAHETSFMVTATVGITTFWSLAIYVVTRRPRRSISWLFGASCLTIANMYFSSLLLCPQPGTASSVTPFALRWKWAVIIVGIAFYVHVMSYYSPPAWRRYRPCALLLAYVVNAVFALAALFTDLLIAGPLHRAPPRIVGPVPGPLMWLCAGLIALELAAGIASLLAGYRATMSPSARRQILRLLAPTGLIILAAVPNWAIVLTEDAEQISHMFGDVLLIAAGCSYAWAILRHGSLVGYPLNSRDLVYSVMGAASGLLAIYVTMALDRQLAIDTQFPYPVATGLLVLLVTIGYPAVRQWVTGWLDGLFFRAERRQWEVVRILTEPLAEAPDPEKLLVELLRLTCDELRVCGGYLAFSGADSPSETLTVCTVEGNLSAKLGDRVRLPPLQGNTPMLITGLLPEEQEGPGWRDVGLFCPLIGDERRSGLLALGERQDGRAFTHREMIFCGEMATQIGKVRRMAKLREMRDSHIAEAHVRDQELRHLERQVEASANQAVVALQYPTAESAAAPVEIRVLGPMQVSRQGKLIAESEWGTEKAKAMLAYLLWKGPAGATRDELIAFLWPDRPVSGAANVFHVTLHHLRRVLEPGIRQPRDSRYMLHEGRRYRFNSGAPHWLDVTAFQDLATSDDESVLREAVALYRGPYLGEADWDLPAEAEIQRRAIERTYVDVLQKLIARLDAQEAMPFLERLLAVEPAEEAAHRALVLGYLTHGQRDLARRQAVRWRQALDELGLEPSPETTALWHRVMEKRTGDADLSLR
jgi:DNA-binding SARP family transcriptional activator